MSKNKTLEAVLALRKSFAQLNVMLDNHIAACIENNKKAA
jgi:hypothetical protein